MEETSTRNMTYGFWAPSYNQIIIFQSKKDLQETLGANPHMEAIAGLDDFTRKHFPGAFIAGVKSSLHKDGPLGLPSATQIESL